MQCLPQAWGMAHTKSPNNSAIKTRESLFTNGQLETSANVETHHESQRLGPVAIPGLKTVTVWKRITVKRSTKMWHKSGDVACWGGGLHQETSPPILCHIFWPNGKRKPFCAGFANKEVAFWQENSLLWEKTREGRFLMRGTDNTTATSTTNHHINTKDLTLTRNKVVRKLLLLLPMRVSHRQQDAELLQKPTMAPIFPVLWGNRRTPVTFQRHTRWQNVTERLQLTKWVGAGAYIFSSSTHPKMSISAGILVSDFKLFAPKEAVEPSEKCKKEITLGVDQNASVKPDLIELSFCTFEKFVRISCLIFSAWMLFLDAWTSFCFLTVLSQIVSDSDSSQLAS